VRKKAGVAVGAMVVSGAAGSSVADAVLDIAVNQIDSVQITKPNEWAADNLALTYLLNTNYNPGASAAMWQRVMEKMKSSSKNFAVKSSPRRTIRRISSGGTIIPSG
jgi:beta-barrel assembly-enhancing protease